MTSVFANTTHTVHKSAAETSALDVGGRWASLEPSLRAEIGENAFVRWIVPLAPLSCDGGVLTLAAPTRFVRDWVKTHYLDRIRGLWVRQLGSLFRIDVVVAQEKAQAKAQEQGAETTVTVVSQDNSATPVLAPAPENLLSSPLDARMTFDSFAQGLGNELAVAAARRVALGGKAQFNPLFIYGGVGTGKTHLLNAIAQELQRNVPEARVMYMSSEKFMYGFVRALRNKDTMSFKEALRKADILLMDDVQFICGKESTQEEFLYTFSALMDMGKQVVISADRPPAQLAGLDERLRSRLMGGLAVEVTPADETLRLAILRLKCLHMQRPVPDEVLQLLAQRVTANARELEGSLNRLIAFAELTGQEITVSVAERILADVLRAVKKRLSVEDIQDKVAGHFGIRPSDMHSPRRARPVARPRQIAMYLCKVLTEFSLPEIGRKFGGRDHTTIIHGIRKIEELMAADKTMAEEIALLKQLITE